MIRTEFDNVGNFCQRYIIGQIGINEFGGTTQFIACQSAHKSWRLMTAYGVIFQQMKRQRIS